MNYKTQTVNKRKLSILLMFALAMVCFVCSVVSMVGYAEPTLSNVEILDQYNIGQEIELGDGTLTVGGQDYVVKPKVVYPDGTAYSNNNLTLNQLGKYSVVYEVEVGGKYYSQVKQFNVYDYLFTNSVSGETFYYGKDTQAKLADSEVETIRGLRFDLTPGEQLKYNKVINLNNYESDDTLIKLEAVPEETQVRDASVLFILLTDVYDPTNVVTIRIRKAPDSPNNNYSYIQAIFGNNKLEYYTNGRYYYGKGFDNGLNGRTKSTAHIDLRFDYASKSVYSYNTVRSGLVLVRDLVNEFGNNPWGGFTTGEVWLSLYASSYASTDTSKPFHGMILEIDGQDLTQKEEGTFSSSVVTTTNAQNVVYGEYETAENVPNAMVGYSYKVFDSEHRSIYGGEKLYTNVYYGYTSSSRYEVPVVNGYFTPDKIGVYTIVYTVVDVFGNVSETKLDVTALPDDGYGIYVEVPGYENYTSGNVGEKVDLVSASDIITEGNFGFVDVTVTAIHQSGLTVDATETDFIPVNGGDWKIVYTVKDYAGRVGKFSYDLTINVSDKVVFGKVQDFPKYLIVNQKNPIPSLEYIDYNASSEVKYVNTIYAEKDGVKVADITNYFMPNEAGEYNIVYEQYSSVNTTEPNVLKVPVKAIDVGYDGDAESVSWQKNKYFYSANGDVKDASITSNGVNITVENNGSFEFIRPIDAVNLSMSYSITQNSATSKINVILTDTNNDNEKIKISFIDSGTYTIMQINDLNEYNLAEQKFKNATFNFSYQTGIITVAGTQIGVSKCYNGDDFNGFSSLLAYVKFETELDTGVFGDTSIIIDNIGGQSFRKTQNVATVDGVPPKIVISESTLNKYNVGDVVKIPYAKIIDVMCTETTSYLTIKDPDGNVVYDVNGNKIEKVSIGEDYYIQLTKSGSYSLHYAYMDTVGNMVYASEVYSVIWAATREKPTITISGGARSGKVNSFFNVGNAKVTGNFTEYELYIFVLGPSGAMKPVNLIKGESDYMKFMPTEKGSYRVIYMAIDEWENMSTAEYTVKIS